MCFSAIHMCALAGKAKEQFFLSSSLDLVKVGSYDLSHTHVMAPSNRYLYFQWPLAHTEFDMPSINHDRSITDTVKTLPKIKQTTILIQCTKRQRC